MLIKSDDKFIDAAADPARRADAIAQLTKGRRRMFFAACLGFIATFISIGSGKSPSAVLALVAAINWTVACKFESDLRLLKVIERLHR